MITPIDPSADKYPDSKSIILYDNVLSAGSKLTTMNTYEFVSASYFAGPDGDGFSVGRIFQSSSLVNCAAILIKETTSPSVEISVLDTDGLTPVAVRVVDIVGDVVFVEFDEVEASYVRAVFSEETDVYYVAVGQCLKMTQPIYGGHAPVTLSSNTKYESAKSVNGNFIGRTIERQGGETQFDWRNLDPYWYRSTFQPFVEHAKSKPFFIKWRPDYHDEEASYCWTTQDIKPQNQGGGNQLMSVNMSVECYDGI